MSDPLATRIQAFPACHAPSTDGKYFTACGRFEQGNYNLLILWLFIHGFLALVSTLQLLGFLGLVMTVVSICMCFCTQCGQYSNNVVDNKAGDNMICGQKLADDGNFYTIFGPLPNSTYLLIVLPSAFVGIIVFIFSFIFAIPYNRHGFNSLRVVACCSLLFTTILFESPRCGKYPGSPPGCECSYTRSFSLCGKPGHKDGKYYTYCGPFDVIFYNLMALMAFYFAAAGILGGIVFVSADCTLVGSLVLAEGILLGLCPYCGTYPDDYGYYNL